MAVPLVRPIPGRNFATLPDGVLTAGAVVAVPRNLLTHLRGKVTVAWDGGGNHTGPLIREFLRRNKRLTPERLPADAPDLNPVGTVWSWLEHGQLADVAPDGVTDLDDEIVERLVALKFTPALLRKLWEGSDLPFPKRE